MAENSSSTRIMLAASLLTSVPVCPMAMPMSADFRATASFTPSPVMAIPSPSMGHIVWTLNFICVFGTERNKYHETSARAASPEKCSCGVAWG